VAKKKRPGSTNRVRIIGGRFRGRLIQFPDAQGLRPTSDRVRETVFNWLQFDLHDRRVLDLFAGSGALGLEAASRGVAEVILVERAPGVAEQLVRTVEQLDAEQARVIRDDGLAYLRAHPDETFDLVFLDPPFNQDLLQPAIRMLHDRGQLNPGGQVYFEMPVQQPLPELPDGWVIDRVREAGDVRFGLIKSA